MLRRLSKSVHQPFSRPAAFVALPVSTGIITTRYVSTHQPKPKPRPMPGLKRRQSPGSERSQTATWSPRPLEGFNVIISDESLKSLDAERVHRVYCAFHEAEQQNTSKPDSWKQEFLAQHQINPSLLYDIAYFLFATMRAPSADQDLEWKYAWRLMDTAGELGYDMATLDLTRRIIMHDSGIEALRRNFPRLEARFRALVDQGRDPNALVLQAMILMKHGQQSRALEVLQRSKALGEAGTPFPWKHFCLSQMGKVLEKQGSRDQAEECYAELVRENSGLGYYHLAMLYKPDPIAKWLFHRAAALGVPQAVSELAGRETIDYKEALKAGDQQAASKHLLDAQEWQRLARSWISKEQLTDEVY